MDLNIKDVRAEMPNYENYKDWQRQGEIVGIAVHHSATANHETGAPLGNARSFFEYHVNTRGWAHGGYNYVITGDGQIEYALADRIAAYHAGFKDPDNSAGLEYGQFWNNHYLAICLAGWFSENRTYQDENGHQQPIPDNYTQPTEAQLAALLALTEHLRQQYDIPIENVRVHRELAGNSTTCPGHNLDPAALREKLRSASQPKPEPWPEPDDLPQVQAGEHVVLLPDTDKYFTAAMAYIWKFQPDVSFAVDKAAGRWKFVTVLGSEQQISQNQMAHLRQAGAELVQRIPGDPETVQSSLDQLVATNQRFLTTADKPDPEPEPEPTPDKWPTYTVQPGDTLSLIAKQMYGQASLWRRIFEANQNIITDPGRIKPGQLLKIPPQPENS